MYVSIMERKGIEKGRIRASAGRAGALSWEARGLQLGRTETAQNLLPDGAGPD